MAVVLCPGCEQTNKRTFYCQFCLKEGGLELQRDLARLSSRHAKATTWASSVLNAPDGPGSLAQKQVRAELAELLEAIERTEEEKRRSSEEVGRKREEVRKKREGVERRIEALRTAKEQLSLFREDESTRRSLADPFLPSPLRQPSSYPPNALLSLSQRNADLLKRWDRTLKELVERRRILLAELINAYPITAAFVDPASPTPSVASTSRSSGSERSSATRTASAFSTLSSMSGRDLKGKAKATEPEGSPKKLAEPVKKTKERELRILDLPLPRATPASLRRYKPETLSAAASHAAHFLRLIAIYLGVKLPFQLVLGPNPGLKPIPGSVWSAKFPAKRGPYPLYLRPSDSPDPAAPTSRSSRRRASQPLTRAESEFLTGLTMLSWTCLWLLTTQSQSQGGEDGQGWRKLVPGENESPLAYLLKTLASLDLGYRSHVTGSNRHREGGPSTSNASGPVGTSAYPFPQTATATTFFKTRVGPLPRPEHAQIEGADLAVWVDEALGVEIGVEVGDAEGAPGAGKGKGKDVEVEEGWSLL